MFNVKDTTNVTGPAMGEGLGPLKGPPSETPHQHLFELKEKRKKRKIKRRETTFLTLNLQPISHCPHWWWVYMGFFSPPPPPPPPPPPLFCLKRERKRDKRKEKREKKRKWERKVKKKRKRKNEKKVCSATERK